MAVSPWNKSGSVFHRLVLCVIPFRAQGVYPELVWDWVRGRSDSETWAAIPGVRQSWIQLESLHPCPGYSLFPGQGCGFSALISLFSGKLRALMLHLSLSRTCSAVIISILSL